MLIRSTGLHLTPSLLAQKNLGTFPEIYRKTRNYTMTSPERMYALHQAVSYICSSSIPGDIVETGVWRGGSSMVVAHSLLEKGDTSRSLYLYDTFTGMAEPTEDDANLYTDSSPRKEWKIHKRKGHNAWCYAHEQDVRTNMESTGYPMDRVHLVKGRVQDTIPQTIPDTISLLRLDTDWYESTKHEMQHLFPRLRKGGVLFVDDYHYWGGCRKAVDEYLTENDTKLLLQRVDAWGAVALKT